MSFHRHVFRLMVSGVLALSVGVGATMAPAQAAPDVTGDYVTTTHTILSPAMPDEARELIRFNYRMDPQGLGAAVERAGYTYSDGEKPVYTKLEWRVDVTVTGPGNFYDTTYELVTSPDDRAEWIFEPRTYEFSEGKVPAGKYTFEHRVTAGANWLGNEAEGWPYAFRTVYEKSFKEEIVVKGGHDCQIATAKVKKAQAKVTKTKKAAKKAQAKVTKTKKAVKKARGKKATKKAKVRFTKAKKAAKKAKTALTKAKKASTAAQKNKTAVC